MLDVSGQVLNNNETMPALLTRAHEALEREPRTLAADPTARKVMQNVKTMATQLAELRNRHGTGHGRPVPTTLDLGLGDPCSNAAVLWARALPGFLVIVLAELLLPLWARRPTEIIWHSGHITERFGLFTIIVLGESVLAASLAFQVAFDQGHKTTTLTSIGGASVVIVFAMWWLYFDRHVDQLLTSPRVALLWGYGQYLIFASAAALGGGLAVNIDAEIHTARLGHLAVGYATAVPVGVYLLAVWVLHVRRYRQRTINVAFWVTAMLVLLTPFTPAPIPLTAALLAGLVATTVIYRSASE